MLLQTISDSSIDKIFFILIESLPFFSLISQFLGLSLNNLIPF